MNHATRFPPELPARPTVKEVQDWLWRYRPGDGLALWCILKWIKIEVDYFPWLAQRRLQKAMHRIKTIVEKIP
jgi:hypothetical protein